MAKEMTDRELDFYEEILMFVRIISLHLKNLRQLLIVSRRSLRSLHWCKNEDIRKNRNGI